MELTAGNLFYIPPVAHDSWVVGMNHIYRCTFWSGSLREIAAWRIDDGGIHLPRPHFPFHSNFL